MLMLALEAPAPDVLEVLRGYAYVAGRPATAPSTWSSGAYSPNSCGGRGGPPLSDRARPRRGGQGLDIPFHVTRRHRPSGSGDQPEAHRVLLDGCDLGRGIPLRDRDPKDSMAGGDVQDAKRTG